MKSLISICQFRFPSYCCTLLRWKAEILTFLNTQITKLCNFHPINSNYLLVGFYEWQFLYFCQLKANKSTNLFSIFILSIALAHDENKFRIFLTFREVSFNHFYLSFSGASDSRAEVMPIFWSSSISSPLWCICKRISQPPMNSPLK